MKTSKNHYFIVGFLEFKFSLSGEISPIFLIKRLLTSFEAAKRTVCIYGKPEPGPKIQVPTGRTDGRTDWAIDPPIEGS